jgi:hypothetical protein
MESSYENLMCLASEIKEATAPRFLQVFTLGTKPEPILVNIANIASIRAARDYTTEGNICGTEIQMNHSNAEYSESYRVRESLEDVRRGLRRAAVSIIHPEPAPGVFARQAEQEEMA